jgi:hypothetical protein
MRLHNVPEICSIVPEIIIPVAVESDINLYHSP